jgi:holin-like protein
VDFAIAPWAQTAVLAAVGCTALVLDAAMTPERRQSARFSEALRRLPPHVAAGGNPQFSGDDKVLAQLGMLMMFQFVGEALVTSVAIPFPGPLCGMLLLLAYLYLRGGPSEDLFNVGSKLIDNLGLLFVPAGTAIVAYGTLFATDGIAILAALVVSTLLAVFIGGAIAALADGGDAS